MNDLLAVLTATRERLLCSHETVWATSEPEQLADILTAAIEQLRAHQEAADLMRLRLLFAPTGELQEIAAANGWHAEFLVLAQRFEQHVHCP